jgi:UDP:flavonoid glycosyltransferase YjiC (YdhE family)
MKVLFTSVSAIGHIHPMIPLAHALRDAGHDLLWATGPDAGTRLTEAGLDSVAVSEPWEDLRAELRIRFPDPPMSARDMPDHVFPHLFGDISAPRMLAGTMPVARDWAPDLIVHDAAEFAAPIIAETLGVPSVTHGFGTLTPIWRVAAAAEAVAPLWRSAGLDPRPFGGAYDYLYLDIYPGGLQSGDTSHVPHRQSLRPISFDDGGGDSRADSFLESTDPRPLVYLTSGTIERDPRPLRLATEAVAALDVRLIVTVGPQGDPEAIGLQPAHVLVERYVPQSRILRRCSIVASHAGSGTFLATLTQGLPQLCLPRAADQFLNTDACIRAGAGIGLEPADATGAAIASAISRLLTEEGFRSRAGRLATEIAAMPGPAEVVRVLERLAGGA